MNRKIKILAINADSNEFGGVSIFLLNVYRNTDHERFQIDFLTPDTTPFISSRNEIESTSGNIFEFGIDYNTVKGKLLFARKLREFLNEHRYDIVHINSGSISLNCISAVVAKSRKSKVIVHSHNDDSDENLLKRLLSYPVKVIIQKNADVLCACSKAAARHLFTKQKVESNQVIIIKNGIDLHKFQYNEEIRNKIRKELNLEGHFVIGHVGRFVEQKNHEFLIDIFADVLKEKSDAILLLIGQGELENHIKEKVHDLRIEDNVVFLGARNDVDCLYQAMDVLLFPSLFEGLPITLVEAQVSGLPCCISDSISEEIDITPLVYRMPLHESAQKWAEKVLSISANINKRNCYEQEIKKAGYEIENTAIEISNIYERLMQ